jgi:hypothetical protein
MGSAWDQGQHWGQGQNWNKDQGQGWGQNCGFGHLSPFPHSHPSPTHVGYKAPHVDPTPRRQHSTPCRPPHTNAIPLQLQPMQAPPHVDCTVSTTFRCCSCRRSSSSCRRLFSISACLLRFSWWGMGHGQDKRTYKPDTFIWAWPRRTYPAYPGIESLASWPQPNDGPTLSLHIRTRAQKDPMTVLFLGQRLPDSITSGLPPPKPAFLHSEDKCHPRFHHTHTKARVYETGN